MICNGLILLLIIAFEIAPILSDPNTAKKPPDLAGYAQGMIKGSNSSRRLRRPALAITFSPKCPVRFWLCWLASSPPIIFHRNPDLFTGLPAF